MIKKYGSPTVFENFSPHVTLAWDNTTMSVLRPVFNDIWPPKQLGLHTRDFEFSIASVALGTTGPHGTVTSNLAVWPFHFSS